MSIPFNFGKAVEEPSFAGHPWFVPDIAQSSVVKIIKFRPESPDGENATVVVTTHDNRDYSYKMPTSDALDFYHDLDCGVSPGSVWNEIRNYVADLKRQAAQVKVSVTITGPEESIRIIRAHADNLGLEVS